MAPSAILLVKKCAEAYADSPQDGREVHFPEALTVIWLDQKIYKPTPTIDIAPDNREGRKIVYLWRQQWSNPAKECAGADANSAQDGREDLAAVDKYGAEAGYDGCLADQRQAYDTSWRFKLTYITIKKINFLFGKKILYQITFKLLSQ